MQHVVGILLAALLTAGLTAPAMAHRVTVFAWVEDGRIHAQGQFARGKPAMNVPIQAESPVDGTVLASVTTDADGTAILPLPQGAAQTGLTIVLNAGGGHRAEWAMTAADFAGHEPHLPPDDDPGTREILLGVLPLLAVAGLGALAVRRKRREPRA